MLKFTVWKLLTRSFQNPVGYPFNILKKTFARPWNSGGMNKWKKNV